MENLKKLSELTNTLLRVEENLKEQVHVLEFIIENTTDGYWDWNLVTNYEYLSPKFKCQLGYSVDEMENSPESWQKLCNKDDLKLVISEVEKHISGHTDHFEQVMRFTHKEGYEIKIQCIGKVIKFDENGKPLRMVGTHKIIR